jgi:hypothetical protein
MNAQRDAGSLSDEHPRKYEAGRSAPLGFGVAESGFHPLHDQAAFQLGYAPGTVLTRNTTLRAVIGIASRGQVLFFFGTITHNATVGDFVALIVSQKSREPKAAHRFGCLLSR